MSSATTWRNGRSDGDRESGHVVRIERTFAASAEDVFDAWTSPEVMRPLVPLRADWETPAAEVDLRVGGKVRVVMRQPDGTEAGARGEYTLIDRPNRLVMTWTFDDDPSNEQLIELSFSEAEGSTRVLMVNSGISTDERRDAQDGDGTGASMSSRGAGRVTGPERPTVRAPRAGARPTRAESACHRRGPGRTG